MVQEVRRQFADGKIMSGEKRPDYAPVIDICTAASLRELATPALLAVLAPVIIGFGINYFALGAFLAAVILTGQLMANFLSNSGGAWDNAKKYIEDGNYGGKGSDAYRAAVIGDTIGDPFKDTAGPALNPLIKVINLVSLLILPAVISLRDNDVRFVIAGVALVVLDRRDPVLEARRRDVGVGGRGRSRAAARRSYWSVSARCRGSGAGACARLCLRYSRNGGINDNTMITATIGRGTCRCCPRRSAAEEEAEQGDAARPQRGADHVGGQESNTLKSSRRGRATYC